MYVLVERLTGSAAAAFVSALLFGFHPYRFEHYSHFELQMTYCMPLRAAGAAPVRGDGPPAEMRVLGRGAVGRPAVLLDVLRGLFHDLRERRLSSLTCWLTRAPVRRLLGPAAIGGGSRVGARVAAGADVPRRAPRRPGGRDGGLLQRDDGDYFRAHPRSATWGERTLPGRQPERALFPGQSCCWCWREWRWFRRSARPARSTLAPCW